jgi:hypothetical protein
LYLQFQFKSFYKIHQNTSLPKSFKKKNFFSRALMYIIILLIFSNKRYKPNLSNLVYAVFQTPIKKKSVIFLRAPYKNKLARLNILKLEFTTILSIKCDKFMNFNHLNDVFNLKNYNFSTHKLKHKKTKINFMYKLKKNFQLNNFI